MDSPIQYYYGTAAAASAAPLQHQNYVHVSASCRQLLFFVKMHALNIQMCNVQLHSNFSMQWHFQISLCPALSGYLLFLTNCTKQSHFTKLLCRNVLRSAKFKSIFFSSFHCIKINQNSNVHKIRYYFKIVIDFYMLP